MQTVIATVRDWLTAHPGASTRFLIALVFYALLANAWVTEDAYITLRSVDQVLAGNGPRWNPHERVQAYTHPPWFWLLVGVRTVVPHPFIAAILLGLVVSLLAIGVLYRDVRKWRGPPIAALAVCTLVSSKAVMDFTTSGLENSLSYLLVLAILIPARRYLEPPTREPRSAVADSGLFLMVLLGFSILTANRPDSCVLMIPLCGVLAVTNVRRRGLPATLVLLVAGAVPLFLTIAFSLFYYGMPLPNTAYAKLIDANGPLGTVGQGLAYLGVSSVFDPLLAAMLFGGIALAFRSSSPRAYWRAVGAGIALQVVALIGIGGDYMAGRLFAPAVVAAIFVVMHLATVRHLSRLACVLVLFLLFPFHPLHPLADHYETKWALGVTDERASYYAASSLEVCVLSTLADDNCPRHWWVEGGRAFKKSGGRVTLAKNIGFFGQSAALDQIVVDQMALSDAFLARLPLVPDAEWRAGHGVRKIPEGYLETLETGENRIVDPNLREYYEHLRVLTQAPLLAPGRLRTILLFNLGRYDSLLEAAAASPAKSGSAGQGPTG